MLKPHYSAHWKEDIQRYGMPIYFSTNHHEPKHKSLKLVKQKQTNQHNHSRDILVQEWLCQMERTGQWNKALPFPSLEQSYSSVQQQSLVTKAGAITACYLVKPSVQAAFLENGLTEQDFVDLGILAIQTRASLQVKLHKLDSLNIQGTKFKHGVDIMYGSGNKLFFWENHATYCSSCWK